MPSDLVQASADLLRRIESAFADVPQPPPDLLYNTHCIECREVSDFFAVRPWQAVAVLTGRIIGTPLLTAEAWRYYLPAILIWCVRDTAAADVLVENTVSQLTPPADGESRWFTPRCQGFNVLQCNAIVAFLDWYRATLDELAGQDPEPVGGLSSARAYWVNQSTQATAD